MVFSSEIFLCGFLPAVLVGYFCFARSLKAKNIFLCVASLLFYAWGEPFVVFVMIASIMANWLLALVIDRYRHRVWLIVAASFNILLLFAFKYMGFVVSNINAFVGSHIEVPQIKLPIGISFFTFQALSYVVDVYRNIVPAQRKFLGVALYISLFPQLVAGPIVRYSTVERQIASRTTSINDFVFGARRFVVGLAKKVLLADRLAEVADIYFNAPEEMFSSIPVTGLWLGAVAYAFQILFDFSGYSDMAIGLGRIFGFRFDENFNYPYSATSITDFWRRWHMSLSSWFRDYVYIPLGGNRVNRLRLLFNLFVVWCLTGLWHGANWTFIVWGLGYFILLSAEKFINKNRWPRFILMFGRPYALLCILILWIPFRAENLGRALCYLKGMFGFNDNVVFDEITPHFLREFGPWIIISMCCCFC